MHSPSVEGEWYKAAVANGIRLYDIEGHLCDASAVVNDAVAAIVRVKNGDRRRRLEYVLLGNAMPLEDRKQLRRTAFRYPEILATQIQRTTFKVADYQPGSF